MAKSAVPAFLEPYRAGREGQALERTISFDHRMTGEHSSVARPPLTLEGWYVLHQLFTVNRLRWRSLAGAQRSDLRRRAQATLDALVAPGRTAPDESANSAGWSAVAQLVGSRAELMAVHLRPSLDSLHQAQEALLAEPIMDYLDLHYSFLSVTEAGLYHLSAALEAEGAAELDSGGGAASAGGSGRRESAARSAGAAQSGAGPRIAGSGESAAVAAAHERVQQELARERENPFVKRRLYPDLPPDMPYICFYPMSKRRAPGQNWYALSLEERSRLMQSHGVTGRRYAGRVLQIITGAIGLSDWEWGVTLFSGDPLEFKKLVTDMRFDEVSAQYADFGEFFVGKVVEADSWLGALG